MKRKILYISAVAIISLTSFIIGRNSVENVPEQAQETVTEMSETYIDTEEIESVTIGTDGLELNFLGGTKQKERSHDYDNSRKIFSRLYI